MQRFVKVREFLLGFPKHIVQEDDQIKNSLW